MSPRKEMCSGSKKPSWFSSKGQNLIGSKEVTPRRKGSEVLSTFLTPTEEIPPVAIPVKKPKTESDISTLIKQAYQRHEADAIALQTGSSSQIMELSGYKIVEWMTNEIVVLKGSTCVLILNMKNSETRNSIEQGRSIKFIGRRLDVLEEGLPVYVSRTFKIN